jgi:hypothetical protein
LLAHPVQASRIAAALLFLVSAGILATTLMNAGSKTPSRNLTLAFIAVAVSLRAIYATLRLPEFGEDEVLADDTTADAPSKPQADFISHPKEGLEATASNSRPTACYNRREPKDYDERNRGLRLTPFLAILILSPLLIAVGLGPITGVVPSLVPQCNNLAYNAWTYCQGTWGYGAGGRYDGEIRGGVKNGQGTYIWPNGLNTSVNSSMTKKWTRHAHMV